MLRLLNFIRSTYVVVLFIIVEIVAISTYAHSNGYTRSRILAVSNSVTGGVSSLLHNGSILFKLPEENRALSERIAQLETILSVYQEMGEDEIGQDEILFFDPAYKYRVARVVHNTINHSNNYFVLNKGIKDDIYQNMALITPSGQMLGYIVSCSENYSVALSILSTDFTSSGKIEGSDNYGSIRWSGDDRYHVTMSNLSKYEKLEVGKKVVSTGFSQIFPGGVSIGKVASFTLNEMQTAYTLDIELDADITATNYVLIVSSRDNGEIEDLLEQVKKSRN